MTDVEREYLTHVWKWLKPAGLEGAMASARRFAELDPYRLARLPELLQAEIDKHHARKKAEA